MRFRMWLWISVLTILIGSIPLLASDRDRDQDQNREASHSADRNSHEWMNGPDNGWQEDGRDHEREWREYLRSRNKAYKEYARASRREREEFANFLREYDRRNEDRQGNWDRRDERRSGACFYTDSNYGGRSFCLDRNESQRYVGDGFNDEISSIRVFGRSRVIAYEHKNFGGARRTYSKDASGLGKFNDKISSIEVR
jgi:hypothetical protein